MDDRIIKLQVFFEIAMGIGNSLDIQTMLKESLQVYLRRLNFSAGIVYQARSISKDTYGFERLFSIPRLIDGNPCFRVATQHVPGKMQVQQIKAFYDSLPITGTEPGGSLYCIMDLPDFGLMVFIMDASQYDPEIINTLKSLNEKLARACIACLQNEQLEQEVNIRKQSEIALVQSENRLRTILDSVQVGIVIIDAREHIVLDANPEALNILERSREELIGNICHECICPKEQGKCPITDLNKASDSSQRFVLNRMGESVPVLKTSTPIELSGKACLLECFLDLRPLKKAEQERDAFEKQLQQAHKLEAIGNLAGGIAHDFNNILSSVIGFSELALDDSPANSEQYHNIEQIIIAGIRARSLIKQILTFARQQETEPQVFKLAGIVKEALNLLRSTIPAYIEIHENLNSECGILADPVQIHQLVMNLCTNAVHAMEQNGGVLNVTLIDCDKCPPSNAINLSNDDISLNQEWVRFSVKDNGIGMASKILDAIFDPFFTTKEPGKGTGMGLAVVHGVVKKFNGLIQVTSQVGEGSTFDVYFPRVDLKTVAHHQNTNQNLIGKKEHILFIDDESSIAEMAKQMLEKLGYRVTILTDALEALRMFEQNSKTYQIVISDVSMPKLTGDRLAVELLKIRPDIPVILCTGYSDKISPEKAKQIGVKSLVMKPLVRNELNDIIRQVLDFKKN